MTRTIISTDIKHIVDNINYHQILQVMELMNWTWYNSNTETGVPSVKEMKEKSIELLNRAAGMALTGVEAEQYFVDTGGFRAEATRYGNDVYLRLSFQVESWDNHDQFEDDLSGEF
jgi:hypothetical protein